ncbi:MAG: hypothetical protein J5I93_13410 [Pirellulaceae bacterium]|nr:hypothetical protein [Pirellulaceae bacterium]
MRYSASRHPGQAQRRWLARQAWLACWLASACSVVLASQLARADTKTWDGRHGTRKIEVKVVYFVPSDRQPLPDWRERMDYYCRRIELFHAREFQGQSVLKTVPHPEPLVSELTTAELRRGDGDAIFFRTLGETSRRLGDGRDTSDAFPVLLVLSEINWRPLDDFYRLKPHEGQLEFEGTYSDGEHFPGAASGGARATYRADQRVGWGLVSADGWRVPYRGSDCVVYHEGCGHTVGLPHPQPGNGSVMSLGQYRGWISESWLDEDQKRRVGWQPPEAAAKRDPQLELFSSFRALPQPRVPRPNQPVTLDLDWPAAAQVKSLRVRFQTAVPGPWVEVPQAWTGDAPATASLATFDRETPVSYRVDAQLQDGSTVELWGYLQVRANPRRVPQPYQLSPDLLPETLAANAAPALASLPKEEIDLLPLIDPAKCWQAGQWSKEQGKLLSPKQFGARLELPYSPPPEYRLTVIVEPLDEPDGLLLGQRVGEKRFVTLLNYRPDKAGLSAIENVDGLNVGNDTTFTGDLFQKNRLSQAIVTVTRQEVTLTVDGRLVIHWKGDPSRLSLSDYWRTPDDKALFLGAYNCRYRFHRLTLEPLAGQGDRNNKGAK